MSSIALYADIQAQQLFKRGHAGLIVRISAEKMFLFDDTNKPPCAFSGNII